MGGLSAGQKMVKYDRDAGRKVTCEVELAVEVDGTPRDENEGKNDMLQLSE